jgi:hypothetical protein
MAKDLFTNQASTTVAASKTAPAAGTTESWTVASSSAFPAASSTTFPASQFYVADPAAPTELILVTNVSGTTWDVTRGADGTTPVSHSAGFTIKNVVPSAFLQNMADRLQQETYSVKDFGAKGDNSNADHVGIQAALDTAWKQGGGKVIVPRGIYRVMGGTGALRIRSNVTLSLLPGAEIHRYNDSSSMIWNGDGAQVRAGWTGHGNITVEGGVFDMRCSSSTHGCTAQVSGGTTAPAAGTSESWTVTSTNTTPNQGFPQVPFYVYDPAQPTETMKVTAVSSPTSSTPTWTVTRGAGPLGATAVTTHSAGFVIRNADMALARDLFTRSNTSQPHTLGVMDTGQTWINESSRGTSDQGTGCLGITSNTVFAQAALTTGSMSTVFAWPDGSVNCTIPTTGSSGFAGLVFRVGSADNYWQYVRDNTTGNAKLSYFVNRTETVVTPTATTAVAAGSTLRVVFYGSTVKCYVGTTLTHDTTDSNFTTNRKVGLIISDTTSRLDTFESSAIIWSDSFTRANSTTTPGNANSLEAWTEQQGNLGISSSAVYAPANGTNIATLPATSETCPEARMTVAGNAGLVFRYKDNNNYWAFYRDASDSAATLIKVVNGSPSTVSRTATQTVSANDILRVVVNGWMIRTYVDNVKTHETVDSQHYQENKVGVIIYDTTARIDDFQAVVGWGGTTSGACFNFGHGENILFRDTTIRDTSANSHAIEIAGCKNVLSDNVNYSGMAPIWGRWSEAFQMDLTKGSGYFAAFGPHDSTNNRDVVFRGNSVNQSYMPGTTAWIRGIGSHTATIDVWHDHLRVVDNYFETTERAIRAYNWNNVFLRGNAVIGGQGIEVRVPDVASPVDEDTINNAGTQTSASQPTYNIQIEGNIIYADYSTSDGNVYAIQVLGESSTASANGVLIRGNDIRWSRNGGIWVQFGVHVSIVDNLVNSTAALSSGQDLGWHGIKVDTCQHSLVSNNQVFRAGSHGIYMLAGNDIRAIGNYIRGASRSSAGASSCMKVDSTPDDVTLIANVTRLWGSGNEPAWGLHTTTGTNIRRISNDFQGGGTSGDVSAHSGGDIGNLIAGTKTSDQTSLSSTSYADVTSLTCPVNVTGWYKFKAFISFRAVSGTSPTITFGVTGPTASVVVYNVTIQTATAGTTSTFSAGSYLQNTSQSAAVTTGVTYGAMIDGYINATATGTNLKVQYKAGGTSPSFSIFTGSNLVLERIIAS